MRVYFRAFEMSDIDLFIKFRNDEDIYNNITGNKFFVSTEREKKWIEDKIHNDKTNIYLAICLKDNDQLIGYTSVNNIDLRNRNALWGSIFIDPSYRGKGISIDVGILLLRFVFEEMPIYRFYSGLLEKNVASMKMVAKLGFKQEGIQRSAIFKQNTFHDMVTISMLKPEYEVLYGEPGDRYIDQ
ncbi:MAG: GNAT family N-acetyltransferase [Candidatus Cloacimonetes bacterium]|nr:GNAT family N-acetyltransferase [Candidatus Cloacimonadota bacterium]